MKGRKDAEVEAEIRAQLAQQGWVAGDVAVRRGDDTTTVTLGAEDGAGVIAFEIMQQVSGAQPSRLQIQPEAIDDKREPGHVGRAAPRQDQRPAPGAGLQCRCHREGRPNLRSRATKHAQ